MSELIQVSANEIKFLVKRSVEGLGFPPGDQLSAGIKAAAAFQLGLANSKLLDKALDALNSLISAPVLVSSSNQELQFDAQGQSALVQVELALGLTLAKAVPQLRIKRVAAAVFAVPCLMNWLAQPLSRPAAQQCYALYFAHHTGAQRCVLIAADGQLLGLYQPSQRLVAADELLLCMGQADIDGLLITDGADLLGWRERCLDQGIHLDAALVSRLKRMMQASFVPETEASRAGAGPG
ncbi:hypothetical protein ABXT60_05400 [Candidatus Njordibacter sp. Uisw_056]|jgi:hypothetical protein|uniref:hypothetical protein n=1 Tax=Candidatus Njordibacter sp. Uisw_056 TaxID=3230973 RepID=UPI003D45CA61|tara:strand:+ start:8653 stop:9366 length:714 start_codon:yes stop_codon:yes gene_type:complete